VHITQNVGIIIYYNINVVIFWRLYTKRKLPVDINRGCKNEFLCDKNNNNNNNDIQQ